MNDIDHEPEIGSDGEARVGGFARVAGGLLFLFMGLISAASVVASLAVMAPRGSVVVSVVIAGLISCGCLLLSYRLLANRPRSDGGLISPTTLRIFAIFFVGLPIFSLATGAWKTGHIPFPLVLAQGLLYCFWGLAMWRLATRRRSPLMMREVPNEGEPNEEESS